MAEGEAPASVESPLSLDADFANLRLSWWADIVGTGAWLVRREG